jgi:predicted nuclease of predicted toxin-antitoxin system
MSLSIPVDMNLSPDWIPVLRDHGWPAVHWSSVGDIRAPDREIMAWALSHDHIVFTHDLDFGTMLALTHGAGPSVLQIRGSDILPQAMETLVLAALDQHEPQLSAGALVVVDVRRSRVRVLPL